MSKGLEALKRIKMLEISCDRESYDLRPITKTHKEDLSTIEKELKALEIIKEKRVDCWALISDLFTTNEEECGYAFSKEDLTKEEIDLLKEVLI